MTRSVAPFSPSLEIFKRFQQNVSPQIENLSAYLIGAAAELVRFNDSDEKANGRLGTYDPTGSLINGTFQTSYSWPNISVGGVIDDEYTKLNVVDGLFKYGDVNDGTLEKVGINAIQWPGENWATNVDTAGTVYPGDVRFKDRGIEAGDRVLVTGVDEDGNAFELASYVQGFQGVLSVASFSAATADSLNQADTVAGSAVVDGGTNSGNTGLSVDNANYNGLEAGQPTEVYTFTVIQASTGADATTGLLSVTSASGLDDVSVFAPASYGVAKEFGLRGLELTLTDAGGSSDLVVGDTFTATVSQDYTAPVITISGAYGAADQQDRTYLVEVVSGEAADSGPVIRLTTTEGNDVGTVVTLVDAGSGVMQTLSLGSYGLLLDITAVDGLVTGDKWLVQATAAKEGAYETLLLAHNLPSNVASNDSAANLQVQLYILASTEIPKRSATPGVYNFTTSSTELLVKGAISVELPQWTDSGNKVPLPLSAPAAFGSNTSVLYVTYRAWAPVQSGLLSVTSPEELDAIPGPVDPDNPLKYGLSKALLANNGRPVYYFNTSTPSSIAGWEAALKAADGTRATYGFVPLSRDSAVLDLIAGHVDSRSGPSFNMYRVAWFTADDVTSQVVLSSDVGSTNDGNVLATISDDPNTSGTQFTLVEVTSANAELATLGVRPGDTLRFGFATDAWGDETYDEYVVNSVLNESSLLLVGGPSSSEDIPRKIEIHRTLTPAEKVSVFEGGIAAYTLNPDGSSSSINNGDLAKYPGYLFRVLAFGTVYDGALEVPSYFQAAVLAAARSALAPHQPLTRFAIPGFSGVKGTDLYSAEQLNEIAASGGWINVLDIETGDVVVRHAVTAGDWDNVNTREESIISNVDSVSFYLFGVLNPYIGRANNTNDTLAMIQSELKAADSFLQSANYAPGLGGQINSLSILDIRPSPVAKDSVYISLELDVPGPLNRIRTDLLIV